MVYVQVSILTIVAMYQQIRDSDHGPKFCKRMHEINSATFPDSQVRYLLCPCEVRNDRPHSIEYFELKATLGLSTSTWELQYVRSNHYS